MAISLKTLIYWPSTLKYTNIKSYSRNDNLNNTITFNETPSIAENIQSKKNFRSKGFTKLYQKFKK